MFEYVKTNVKKHYTGYKSAINNGLLMTSASVFLPTSMYGAYVLLVKLLKEIDDQFLDLRNKVVNISTAKLSIAEIKKIMSDSVKEINELEAKILLTEETFNKFKDIDSIARFSIYYTTYKNRIVLAKKYIVNFEQIVALV